MKSVRQIKQRHYDKYDRYKESQKFYHSSAWKSAREMKLRQNPLCECCQQAGKTVKADMVHHMIPVKKGTNNLDLDYMVSLCHACHNRIETEMENDQKSKVIGRLSYNDK